MSSKDGTYSGGVDGCEEVSCRRRDPHLRVEMCGSCLLGKRHALVKTHAARSLPAYSAEQQHLFLILRNWHAA